MGVTGGEPLGFNVGAQGPGGTLPGLDLVRFDSHTPLLPVSAELHHRSQAMRIPGRHSLSSITQQLCLIPTASCD